MRVRHHSSGVLDLEIETRSVPAPSLWGTHRNPKGFHKISSSMKVPWGNVWLQQSWWRICQHSGALWWWLQLLQFLLPTQSNCWVGQPRFCLMMFACSNGFDFSFVSHFFWHTHLFWHSHVALPHIWRFTWWDVQLGIVLDPFCSISTHTSYPIYIYIHILSRYIELYMYTYVL